MLLLYVKDSFSDLKFSFFNFKYREIFRFNIHRRTWGASRNSAPGRGKFGVC